MNDLMAFARLIDAIRPWHDKLVLVGGWAHRMYRLHRLADPPPYEPVLTKDADLAFSLREPPEGDIAAALRTANFTQVLSGSHTPPVSHYTLGQEEGGFYAEFLAPLSGSRIKRNGVPDATVAMAGITAQKLRHLDLLLIETLGVDLEPTADLPLSESTRIRLPNPVNFIAQKLLIQHERLPEKRSQDLLYIHDTIDLFAPHLNTLGEMWRGGIRPKLTAKRANAIEGQARGAFAEVTDVIREASRIPQDRRVSAEEFRALCEIGLTTVFGHGDNGRGVATEGHRLESRGEDSTGL